MSYRLRHLVVILMSFSFATLWPSLAESQTQKSFSPTPRVIYARTYVGEIHSIDLADHTAMIGGYRFYFGSSVYGDASKVQLYGYNSGSFELLQVGMKVSVRYAEYGIGRYVLSLQELAPDTDIHAPGVKVDP